MPDPPEPITRPTAATRRRASNDLDVTAGVNCLRAGSAKPVASGSSGTRPRKTQRQPARSATIPANAGPTSPGTTQALESTASMRGFTASGYPHPTQTKATEARRPAPKPCTPRLKTSMSIEDAAPARMRPRTNSTTPAMKGRTGPRRSASLPARMIPTKVASI